MISGVGSKASLLGLSTDQKPMNAENNTIFLELDTGNFFYFDGTKWLAYAGVVPEVQGNVVLDDNNKLSGFRFDVVVPDGAVGVKAGFTRDVNYYRSIVLPEGCTSIDRQAFQTFVNLETVVLPSTMETIGDYAFNFCAGLKSFTCKAVVPPTISTYTFSLIGNDAVFYVPAGSVDAYKAAWTSVATKIQAIPTN